ncbi:response regulator [Arenibacter latericius]|uniref:response regulator n=1 Tax=Arenibacter latericius TaxID=86104 RepID=UPI00040A5408|nr:response regulator [Arenibacter latericius]MDX1363561.1 response regulator [Arenibacter latericius]
MKTIKQVCIIDDDPIFVFGTKRMLTKNNFCSNIEVYTNGEDALESISLREESNFPDIIFLDLNMPVMDGWEFLDEFSKLSKKSKVLLFVLSSSIDSQEVQRAKTYDVVYDFIEKPLTKDKIGVLINKLGIEEL